MRRRDGTLVAATVCGLLGVAAAFSPSSLPAGVTAPLAALLVLLAPGWALQALVLPWRPGLAERLVAATVASLALTIALALALSVSTAGYGRSTVLATLGGLTAALGAAALVRMAGGGRPALPAMLVVAVAVAVAGIGAVALYAASGTPRVRAGGAYTLLGGHRDASGVAVDVWSAEARTTSYTLRVAVEGQRGLATSFSLRPGGRRTATFSASPRARAVVVLERVDAPGVAYRRIVLQGG